MALEIKGLRSKQDAAATTERTSILCCIHTVVAVVSSVVTNVIAQTHNAESKRLQTQQCNRAVTRNNRIARTPLIMRFKYVEERREELAGVTDRVCVS